MMLKEFYDRFKEEFVYLKEKDEVLPSPIMCDVPNTMEHDTIVRRIPEVILGRIIEQNKEYTESMKINVKLEKIRELFKNAESRTYEKIECKIDEPYWTFFLNYFIEKDIKMIKNTWIFNEYYFYRCLSSAYDFENTEYDFCQAEKYSGITENKEMIEKICKCCLELLEIYKTNPDEKIFAIFFFFALWSNQFDLSWNPTKGKKEEKPGKQETPENDLTKRKLEQKEFYFNTDDVDKLYNSMYVDKIIRNDVSIIYKDIQVGSKEKKQLDRFDIVLDNMGMEFITDLTLLLFLSNFFKEIVIHVKKFPLFISDTMRKDIHFTLDHLEKDSTYPNANILAKECKKMISSGRWKIKDDIYWNLPLPYWIMSKSIYNEFKNCAFACFKGDANYRRCLGDLRYDLSSNQKENFKYFPCKVIALRCLKSPVGCGIDRNIVEKLSKNDKHWSNYGEFAVLQYSCAE